MDFGEYQQIHDGYCHDDEEANKYDVGHSFELDACGIVWIIRMKDIIEVEFSNHHDPCLDKRTPEVREWILVPQKNSKTNREGDDEQEKNCEELKKRF